jgi:hypothetical protein
MVEQYNNMKVRRMPSTVVFVIIIVSEAGKPVWEYEKGLIYI